MYRVINLVLVQLSRHTNDEAQSFLVILLTEHSSHSGVRGVGVQDVGLVSVGKGDDDESKKAPFQLLEGALLRCSPVPYLFPG